MSGGRKPILLGRIVAAHGIRGEVQIVSHTAAPDAIGGYGPLADAAGQRHFTVRVVRVTPKGVIARIEGVTDRNAAEALRGTDLYVDRARLPPPGEGEYYHEDLIGLAAHDADGKRIGAVVAMPNYGAGDLVEIKLDGSRQTELIPFQKAFVPTVDVAAGRITVILPGFAPDDGDGREGEDGEGEDGGDEGGRTPPR